MTSEPLKCQRQAFDLPDNVNYLNCAYQSPKLRKSLRKAEEELRKSAHPWVMAPDDFFAPAERLRTLFAQLIDAGADDIAIVPSVSYGISTAMNNLPLGKGQSVVVCAQQFPSNYYPWRDQALAAQGELTVIDRPAPGSWSGRIIDAIDTRCATVALPGAHWTDGYLLDLPAIAERCRDSGAALVLDLTQSLGVVPFSVRESEVDFVACASYKWLLGPLGLSFLYVNPRHHDGRPIEAGWLEREGSGDFSRLVDYTDRFQPGARRFDAGERTNTALLQHAILALEQILEWQPARIQDYTRRLTARAAERAEDAGLECTPEAYRAPHLLGIELPPDRIARVAAALAAERIYVSIRGSKLRIAPYLYNEVSQVDRLFDVISTCP